MNGILPNALPTTPERTRIGSADCAICLEDDSSPTALITSTICNHTFHKSCLDKWLNVGNNCPMCRAVLSNRAVEPIERIIRHIGFRSHGELDIVLVSMSRRTHANGDRLVERCLDLRPRQNALVEMIEPHRDHLAEPMISLSPQQWQDVFQSVIRR